MAALIFLVNTLLSLYLLAVLLRLMLQWVRADVFNPLVASFFGDVRERWGSGTATAR